MRQSPRTPGTALQDIPLPHRVMLGALSLVTATMMVWEPSIQQQEKQIELDVVSLRVSLPKDSEPVEPVLPFDELPADDLDDDKRRAEKNEQSYLVSSGDTLSSILNQYGIDISDITKLAEVLPMLRNLGVGQQLIWNTDEQGDLQQLIWKVSNRDSYLLQRTGQGFSVTPQRVSGQWQNQVIRGQVTDSFVKSAKAAGLRSKEIDDVIKALQWQLDFRKLQQGDQFAVVISREMIEDKVEQGQLAGVRLRSAGKDFYAIRGENGQYYDYHASGLTRGLLRFPILRSPRITSGFNLRRLHPITGVIAPHRGVDFALPMGSPVVSVGDGEVVVVRNDPAAGTYIAIRHGRQYMTRYLHLHKVLVQPGQKVKRGERIALSGNSGRSTGPHLHFEVWINQSAVNPLTAKLPQSSGLTGNDRKKFIAMRDQLLPQLQID